MRTRFPIPANPLRKYHFCIFSTPLVRKRENSGSAKQRLKSALFCRRKSARRRKYAPRARRECDFYSLQNPSENANFDFCNTANAKTRILRVLQNSTRNDCFSRFGQNREKARFQPRGVAKILKKGAQDSNEKRLFPKKRPRLEAGTGARIECRPVKRLSDLKAGLPPQVVSRFGPPFLAPLGKDDGSFNTNSLKLNLF